MAEENKLEVEYLPLIQRFLYETTQIYTIAMNRKHEIVADLSYLEEPERERISQYLPRERLMELVDAVENNFMEDIIPVPMQDTAAVCQCLLLKDKGTPNGILCMLGFIKPKENEEITCLDGLRYLNGSEYDKAVELGYRLINWQLDMSAKVREAKIKMELSQAARQEMEADFQKNALLTDIVQMLESENDIVEVVQSIFEKVCTQMNLDTANLYRINEDGKNVSMIGEWVADRAYSCMEKEQDVSLDSVPFMRKETYIVSSNTMLNEDQRAYMEKKGYLATMVLPVYMRQDVIMYLVFSDRSQQRIWDAQTVGFLSDVRKIIQSIIMKRVAQNSLSGSITSMEEIMENLNVGVVVVKPETREILFHNHLYSGEVQARLSKIDLRDVVRDCNEQVEYYIEDLKLWLSFRKSEIMWVDSSKVEMYTFQDVTQQKNYEKKIEKSSNSDFLTGLFNRMRCEQDLDFFVQLAKENGGNGALFFIDLDDFKHINDGLGHQYGDILLKAISSNLRKVKGIESTCYRVGGDEFVVIISDSNYNRLQDILESIEEIFKHPWFLRGADYYCTMSMGICCFPKDADTVEEIIKKADMALFEAKKAGKNCVHFYGEDTKLTDVRRLDMEKFMRDACMHPEEEFEVFYQPIMDVSRRGNPCVGAEALVRWNSKVMGRVLPSDFVPLAEYLGLIKPIGDYVLKQACAACKRWNDLGHPDYKVNVNFSVVQLVQSDMKEKIKRVLQETGLRPSNLTLEVTESLAINDMTYMNKLLNEIREEGVRIALDDFGTGYSSLNHIREMPIDIVKVDRCFVKDVGRDEYSQVFVRMVSELAKAMKMNVCVEGVEDEVQYQIMKENHVNMIQGFFFAEPMPLNEFEMKFVD